MQFLLIHLLHKLLALPTLLLLWWCMRHQILMETYSKVQWATGQLYVVLTHRYYTILVQRDYMGLVLYHVRTPYDEEASDAASNNGQSYGYISGVVAVSDITSYPYLYKLGDVSRSSYRVVEPVICQRYTCCSGESTHYWWTGKYCVAVFVYLCHMYSC